MAKGKFFFAYVDGPNHELIELNTAAHHHFGHLHMLSADPIAAAEWYHEHLGLAIAGRQTQKRIYNGLQVGPSATVVADDVRIIFYPLEYARTQWPATWQTRKDFEPIAGRVIATSRSPATALNRGLSKDRIMCGLSFWEPAKEERRLISSNDGASGLPRA